MKIYIVALMALINSQPEGYQPPMAYVFTTPTFNTVPECKSYAMANSSTILFKLYTEFGKDYRPHMISCVDKGVVDKIKNTSKNQEEELET
tara:strand:- start:3173 stop:3445 length:273 start_codon:yes stop_codon:yes gene_type:complete